MPNRDVVSWNIMIMGYAKREEGAEALELYGRMQNEGVQLSDRTFIGVLKACSSLAALEERKHLNRGLSTLECLNKGRAIHSEVVKSGFDSDVFVGTTLVDMYVKCRSMEDAWLVFDKLPHRTGVSWNSMILGYAKEEQGVRALKLFAQMHLEGVQWSDRTFVSALKACNSLAAVEEGKQVDNMYIKICCVEKGRTIHSHVVKRGFEADVFVGSTLVDMYVKCGSMDDAWCVFQELHHPNVVSWNIMILGFTEQGEFRLGLELYAQMVQKGVTPDWRTLVGILKACTGRATAEKKKHIDRKFSITGCLEIGKFIHSQAVQSGFDSDIFMGNTLVDMYAKCGNLEDARHVFNKLPYCDAVTWTSIILGYAKKDEAALALNLYAQMQQQGVQPDAGVFVGALKACSSLAAVDDEKQVDRKFSKACCLKQGTAIHSQVVKRSFESDVSIGNILVDMYSKCGSMKDAWCVFCDLPHRDVVTWTAMILGFSKQEKGELALDLYVQMHQSAVQPNAQTFIAALKACTSLAALQEGKQYDRDSVKIGCLEKGQAIHSQVVKSGFESDVFVGTSLVDMYTKCGSMEDARCVFDRLPHRDAVSWNAMILAYAEQHERDEAFRLCVQMQEQGVPLDSFTYAAILKACCNTTALEMAKDLHSQISRVGFEDIAVVSTSLIDIYAKCGTMIDAQNLFDSLPERDVVPWSALIAGYSHWGESELVFQLFERMRQEGIWPNQVTFLSVLTSCSHAGLVDKGQKYFVAMNQQYGIVPTIEHYACMIDLLGRSGQVDNAFSTVEKMPFQPDVVVWSTILGACQKWINAKIGRHAFENAVRLGAKLPAAYVLMGNMCVNAHMGEHCDEVQARHFLSMEEASIGG